MQTSRRSVTEKKNKTPEHVNVSENRNNFEHESRLRILTEFDAVSIISVCKICKSNACCHFFRRVLFWSWLVCIRVIIYHFTATYWICTGSSEQAENHESQLHSATQTTNPSQLKAKKNAVKRSRDSGVSVLPVFSQGTCRVNPSKCQVLCSSCAAECGVNTCAEAKDAESSYLSA